MLIQVYKDFSHTISFVSTVFLEASCQYMRTLVSSFTEDSVTFIGIHQSDVFVVSDVLRVLEAIVSTHKVVKCRLLFARELVTKKDVEDLC